jgi:hypothetical protein
MHIFCKICICMTDFKKKNAEREEDTPGSAYVAEEAPGGLQGLQRPAPVVSEYVLTRHGEHSALPALE